MPFSIAVLDPAKGPTIDDLEKVYSLHTSSARYQENDAFKRLVDGKIETIASVMSERHHGLRKGEHLLTLPSHTPLNSTASLLFLELQTLE